MSSPPLLFQPNLLAEPQVLFEHLLGSVAWDTRMKARKTASFGVSYDYSQMAYPCQPMPTELQAVADRVAACVGFAPNNCLLNCYEDGSSSMGFHSDSAEDLAPGTGVAIVSLGSERVMAFRRKADRTVQQSRALPAGSLLYMTQELQQEWLHAIPKAEGAGPRISLTFRAVLKSQAKNLPVS